jgi:thioredoxin 1
MKTIRNILLLVLPMMLIGATASYAGEPDGEVVIVKSSESFYELIESETPVLVDFYADWCRPCRIQGPIVEEIAAEMAGDVIIAKVDVDKFPKIASKYQVSGIPSLILYQKGKQVWKKVGLQQKEGLKAALQSHLKANR